MVNWDRTAWPTVWQLKDAQAFSEPTFLSCMTCPEPLFSVQSKHALYGYNEISARQVFRVCATLAAHICPLLAYAPVYSISNLIKSEQRPPFKSFYSTAVMMWVDKIEVFSASLCTQAPKTYYAWCEKYDRERTKVFSKLLAAVFL